ncbi:MAG: hypothetical protein LC624_06980 [Halobacteriales archaeon]|nr:hypothetical protein [Halobacteriales archaeon]
MLVHVTVPEDGTFSAHVETACVNACGVAILVVPLRQHHPDNANATMTVLVGSGEHIEVVGSLPGVSFQHAVLESADPINVRLEANEVPFAAGGDYLVAFLSSPAGRATFQLSAGSVVGSTMASASHWRMSRETAAAYAKAGVVSAAAGEDERWEAATGSVGFFAPEDTLLGRSVYVRWTLPSGSSMCLSDCIGAFADGPGAYRIATLAEAAVQTGWTFTAAWADLPIPT